MAATPVLQFMPLSSAVDATFWHELGERKVARYRLDATAKRVIATYRTGWDATQAPRVALAADAFAMTDAGVDVPTVAPFTFAAIGSVLNTNTIDDFQKLDKKELLATTANEIWADITSGRALAEPWLLTRFVLVAFSDLKKFKYTYWFAFPALAPATAFTVTATAPLAQRVSAAQADSLRSAYELWRHGDGAAAKPCAPTEAGFFSVVVGADKCTIAPLSQFKALASSGTPVWIGFADPCGLQEYPGWYLRNLLVLAKVQLGLANVTVVCLRERPGKDDISRSLVLDVVLGSAPDLVVTAPCPKAIGWEKNEQDKLQPRHMDLGPMMDPIRLATTSVDLNLRLMRWRLMPSLNLEIVSTTKCLLFGAGTLGCNVARNLLGWGVRHITLLDNGRVSFSNPVRQTLFNYEDCLNGGKPKAVAAADALKRIFPGVTATGHDISVPMPGHTVTSEAQTRKDVELLESLIREHDVVFLLMDTRESRWLPTMLCASYNKICINAALGFDTFLVMRHGAHPKETVHGASRLGCYYCNDVVAPTDSMRDRTLDQQCTVTRPGLSFVASAMCVELMVSILQHPLRHAAPADAAAPPSQPTKMEMGLLPHQVRGFLTHFTNLVITGQAYSKCTACSSHVLETYQRDGFKFLLQVFNNPSFLEDLTGLTELHKEAESGLAEWDVDEDDGDADSGGSAGPAGAAAEPAKAAAKARAASSDDDDF